MDAAQLVAGQSSLWTGLGAIVAIGGVATLALSGWNYAIQGKIKSVSTLWTKFDKHVTDYNANRLADAKEFASRREMISLGNRLEQKIDSSESKLEERICSLGEKIDTALNELRRRDA